MKTFLFPVLMLSLLLSANPFADEAPTAEETPEYIERSLIRFCECRGYDPDGMSEEQINEWLDSWRGSTEEESAMNEEF